MKSKLRSLIKVMFKTDDVMELDYSRKTGKQKLSRILMLILVFILVGISFAPLLAILYDTLSKFGMENLLIKMLFFGASIATVLFGFFIVLSAFYFSKDVENYLYLPVKPGSLVASKFIVSYIYYILTELSMIFPQLVIFGIKSHAVPAFYFKVFAALLIIPIVPLCIVAVITMLIMRFSKLFKNKDAFTLISTIIILVLSVGLSLGIQSFANSARSGQLPPILSGDGPVYRTLSIIFPGSVFMEKAVLGNTSAFFLNTGITVLMSLAAFVLFYLTGNAIYLDGAKGLQETGTKRRKLSLKGIADSTRASGAINAISKKDLNVIFRTPAFLVNCIIGGLIGPLIIAGSMFIGMRSNEGREAMKMLPEMIKQIPGEYIALGIMVYFIFIGSMGLVSATAISREGSNFPVMKFIPVSYKDQILGKILTAMKIELPSVLIIIIPLALVLRLKAVPVAVGTVCGILFSLMVHELSIMLDIRKPVLDWTNEQKAVKQNFNAFISSMGGMLLSFGLFAIKMAAKLNGYLVSAIAAVIAVLFTVYFINMIEKYCEKCFSKRS